MKQLIDEMAGMESGDRVNFFKEKILPEFKFERPMNRDIFINECAKLLSPCGVTRRSIRAEIKGIMPEDELKAEDEPAIPESKPMTGWQADFQIATDPNTGRIRILATRFNVMLMFKNDIYMKGLIGRNEFINQTVLLRPSTWGKGKAGRFWDDHDDAELRFHIEETYGINSPAKIYDCTLIEAERASFHPIKDYLGRLKWDGKKRIDSLLIDYFGAEDTPYVRAVTRKTLVAAVARIYEPGCKFDAMLVLVGLQRIGKSTFFIILCSQEWFNDGLKMSDMESKTASEKVEGYWFLEVAELAGMRKTDIETVKQFLSSQTDIFRPAYGRRKVSNPRQCVIVGTTNTQTGFLRDATGNRRFWPVAVTAGLHKKKVQTDLPMERDQIWAEAVEAYRSGETIYLDDSMEIEAAKIQEEQLEDNPLVGQVEQFLIGRDRTCAAEIWRNVLYGDRDKLTPQKAKEINDVIRKIPGWKPYDAGRGRLRFGELGLQRAFVSTAQQDLIPF